MKTRYYNKVYSARAALLASILAVFLQILLLPACAKLNPFQEPPDHPVIDSLYPASGIVGTQLRIFGSGFSVNTSQDTVSINGVLLRVDSPATGGVMLATIIHYTGTGRVHLDLNGRDADGPVFTMDTASTGQQDPYLTSITPFSGWTDTLVTIKGIHFGKSTDPIAVSFGNQPSSLQKRTDTLLVVKAPAPAGGAAGTVQVSITVINKLSNSLSFTYVAATQQDPLLTGINPASGWTDSLVTIRGIHLGVATDPISVSFGSQLATLQKRTDTLLVVKTPAPAGGGGGTVQVSITVINKVSNSLPFTYVPPQSTGNVFVSTVAGNDVQGYRDGPADSAEFDLPENVAVDPNGTIYVSDNYYSRIRKITTAGVVSTLAGTGIAGFADGPGASAQFYNPEGLILDAQGNLYLADNVNCRIRKITPAGLVTTFVGGPPGDADGTTASARLREPYGITMDAHGNFLVADTYNNKIRKISPAGQVTTVAGNGSAGDVDGPDTSAQFNTPYSLAVDAQGNIYVAEPYSNVIRKIDPSGMVSTYAGTGEPRFLDGPRLSAKFQFPTGITIDGKGNLYVADQLNARVRKISPDGTVSTLAGDGIPFYKDGPGATAEFSLLWGITADAQGNLYVGDLKRIRKITIQ